MKQEMMGWQWHQLDHMQIICTFLPPDKQASSSFFKDALPDAQTQVKAGLQYKSRDSVSVAVNKTDIAVCRVIC